MRVEIMNQDRLTADDHEGYVEWVGQGLAAFADCRGKLGTYPVTLDGNAAGELLCQLQVRADPCKGACLRSLVGHLGCRAKGGAGLLALRYPRAASSPCRLSNML